MRINNERIKMKNKSISLLLSFGIRSVHFMSLNATRKILLFDATTAIILFVERIQFPASTSAAVAASIACNTFLIDRLCMH